MNEKFGRKSTYIIVINYMWFRYVYFSFYFVTAELMFLYDHEFWNKYIIYLCADFLDIFLKENLNYFLVVEMLHFNQYLSFRSSVVAS